MAADQNPTNGDIGFGVDIGGTGMKAAPVDLTTGDLVADRFRIPTPHPATPEAMADVVHQLVGHHGWDRPLGITFPGVIRAGVVETAANLDKSWVGVDGEKLFGEAAGAPVHLVNDADAAGIAEVELGAARGRSGTVILLTFGTGIGSAVLRDGHLLPNTELGHIELDGHDAEHRAAASARERHDLSWHKWAGRVERYLRHLELILSPDLFILGGGVSKHPDKWFDRIDIRTEMVIATLINNAGIAGAALVGAQRSR